MSSTEHKQMIWNLIKDINVGMLVTKDSPDGNGMHARPMYLVQENYDGTLYFFTSIHDEKVNELVKHPEVCITFSDPSNSTFVSMSGTVQLTQDAKLIDQLWNPLVAAWFKGGRKNPDIGILKIKIDKGEHWNSTENKMVQMFEMVKANVAESTTPNIGENEKFSSN